MHTMFQLINITLHKHPIIGYTSLNFNNENANPFNGVKTTVVIGPNGIGKSYLSPTWIKGIWFAGVGTVLTVLALLLCAGWNHTAYYPSVADLQSSLTIQNSSSSPFTLQVMSIVSLLVPFVLAYIFYAWRSIDLFKITSDAMQKEGHTY